MVDHLSLAQAMQVARKCNLQQSDFTLNVICNMGLLQFDFFLQAYMARLGRPVSLFPETYNCLIYRLHNPEEAQLDAGAHLVVVDSFSIGAHPSIRSPGAFNHDQDAEHSRTMDDLLRALGHFRDRAQGQLFILPVMLQTSLFDPYPAGLMSDGWLRAMTAFTTIGTWASRVESTHMLSCVSPQQDEKRFLEAGELFCSPMTSVIAHDVAVAIYSKTQGVLPGVVQGQKKLLITDLDDTFWSGILGDDGVEGLEFGEAKRGKPHWVYQRFLDFLSREGVILAACSKNSIELVEAAMRDLALFCRRDRFALIVANWNRKSQNVKGICSMLNLMPEHAVMIDDDPMELEEIAHETPGISTMLFPKNSDDLLPFLHALRSSFLHAHPVRDVAIRLSSYQANVREMSGSVESVDAPDYTSFLRSLEMVIEINTMTALSRERVFELLNKTNQFNLTGVRTGRREFDHLPTTSTVWTFSLRDRIADHGLIGVAVINLGQPRRLIQCVLSCRVFRRCIEDAMIEFCVQQGSTEILVAKTSRNTPARSFVTRILGNPELENQLSETPRPLPLFPRCLVVFPGTIQIT